MSATTTVSVCYRMPADRDTDAAEVVTGQAVAALSKTTSAPAAAWADNVVTVSATIPGRVPQAAVGGLETVMGAVYAAGGPAVGLTDTVVEWVGAELVEAEAPATA